LHLRKTILASRVYTLWLLNRAMNTNFMNDDIVHQKLNILINNALKKM